MTLIVRVFPRQQVGYYTTFFWGKEPVGGFQNTLMYLGCHPYPVNAQGQPDNTSNLHKWEIASNGGGDHLSTDFVVYDRWYIQVVRTFLNASGFLVVEYYWDWDAGKMITKTNTQTFLDPADPCIMVGDATWNVGDEVYKGVHRGYQFYDQLISLEGIAAEIANPGSIVTPWYLNLNPTPDDISDKSGSGNHPTWVGAQRPSLWTG